MNKLDWEQELDRVTWTHDCSDKVMKGKPTRQQRKDRRNVEKAFAAVQRAHAADPSQMDRDAFRKSVYGFILPGLGWFLGQILITLVVRLVVNYLIDRLFNSSNEGEIVYGDVHVSPK